MMTNDDKAVFTVLMADDDEDDYILVESAFMEMNMNYDLRFVIDGRQLLDYLFRRGDFSESERFPMPNLILLDLNMPLIDGREALTRIKSDPLLKDIPVLVLTTSREERDIAFSREAGASSFLSKPALFDDLAQMLLEFCTQVRQNPQLPFRVIGEASDR